MPPGHDEHGENLNPAYLDVPFLSFHSNKKISTFVEYTLRIGCEINQSKDKQKQKGIKWNRDTQILRFRSPFAIASRQSNWQTLGSWLQ